MKTDQLGMTHKDHQALDVAKLYYNGLSQAEVSEVLHVSRPNVSKLLSHAKKRGFVKITVEDPREKDIHLIETLKKYFQLDEVRLVSPIRGRDTNLHKSLGKAGSQLIASLLRDGDTIGISWSRTIDYVASQMPEMHFNNIHVVQLRGDMSLPSMDFSMMNALKAFHLALNATVHTIAYPIIFESVEAKQAVERQTGIRNVISHAEKARIVVYSVGSNESTSPLMSSPLITNNEKKELTENSVGDICSHFVDRNGRVCLPDLNARTLTISLPELRHKEQRILIAGGNEKLDSIYVALTYKYANRLVIDVPTAHKLASICKKSNNS